MSRAARMHLLVIVSIVAVTATLIIPPFAQPLWYHDFADQRCLFCIPHTLNVLSNAPFLIVGVWGAWYLLRRPEFAGFRKPAERWPYIVFFICIGFTGIGSAYYHSNPNNDRLLWDRLPLAMAFMALSAIVIAERIDYRTGMWLFGPFVALGGGSVIYWHWTETQGQGDLRVYLLVQFLPMLLLPLILLFFPTSYTRTGDLWGALVWYAVAKLFELADKPIYAQGQIVSGHTLKHLVAAGSAYLVLHMVQRRSAVRTCGPR